MTSDSIIKTTDYCGNLIYGQGRPKMLLVEAKCQRGYCGTIVRLCGNHTTDTAEWQHE